MHAVMTQVTSHMRAELVSTFLQFSADLAEHYIQAKVATGLPEVFLQCLLFQRRFQQEVKST